MLVRVIGLRFYNERQRVISRVKIIDNSIFNKLD